MSKRAKKYSKISSMYELSKEKHNLHRQMRVKERELEQDWEWLKEKCSPRNMIKELMGKVYCSSGIARKIMIGFGTMKSLFHGGKSHCYGHGHDHRHDHSHSRSHGHGRDHAHGRCGCGCED